MLKVEKIGNRSRDTALAAIIAACYAAMTVVLMPISYSWIQVRISESLTPLPYRFGTPAVIGLAVGCFIANLISPVGLPDIIFGPLLTLLAAVLSSKASRGRKALACAYPVVVNAFGVSAYLSLFYAIPYVFCVLMIGAGEIVAVFLIGYPILLALERVGIDEAQVSSG